MISAARNVAVYVQERKNAPSIIYMEKVSIQSVRCALCVCMFVCRYLPQIHHCCSGYTSNADGYGRTAILQYNLITKWWSDQVEPIDIIVSAETCKICWPQSTRFCIYWRPQSLSAKRACVWDCVTYSNLFSAYKCSDWSVRIFSWITIDPTNDTRFHDKKSVGRSPESSGFSIQINI